MKPLAIELFSGRFGWGKGFVAEGFQVVGFDILHESYHGPVPEGCELVLQDVLTLHGSQLKDATCIVASPPCQKYSYMAMPWDLSKREIRWQEWERDSQLGNYTLTQLFDACFRLQREASEAAGHYIPMLVENVVGAQRWVGTAAWHHGSFYLWGDVPALMPFAGKQRKGAGPIGPATGGNGTGATSWFGTSRADPRDMRRNEDGEYTRMGLKSEGTKVSGLNWSNHGKPGYKAQAFNGTAAQRYREEQGVKGDGGGWFQGPGKRGGNKARSAEMDRPAGMLRSDSRKAASAAIAEIPIDLSRWIAQCFKP